MSRTLTSHSTIGISLSTYGVANNPFTVAATGAITPTTGDALDAKGGASYKWTIDNFGTITSVPSSTHGIYLGPGTAINSGRVTNESGGLISSGGYGIIINGPGFVTNKSGGTISAGVFKAVYVLGVGTVINSGVITAGNVAVYESSGGSIINQSGGTINGQGGVWFNQPGTFTNYGVVIGTNQGFGAILFNDTSAPNRFVDEPNGTISGNINAQIGGTDVIELASGASAGTLASFGSSITNFDTLQFDSGAQWTVTGIEGSTLAEGFNSLAIQGFTIGDTIDLNSFAATSATFASNVLTLTSAASHATLQIQGAFSTSSFHIASDGSGGTDITFVTSSSGLGHTLSGTYGVAVTLTSPTNNPLTVLSSGKVTPASGAYALYAKGGASQAWTIINAGLVNDGTNGNGIQLGQGGTYVGASTITNQSGGTIIGAYGIRMYNTAASSITNQSGGTIEAASNRGVYLDAAGTLNNSGIISAPTLSNQQVGVLMENGGALINAATGTISGYGGVVLLGAGTVTNAGAIKAVSTNAYAVQLGTGAGTKLIVDPGAVFVGKVAGASGTLELASAVSAGTLTAAGFTNFSAVAFDTGSQWTLAGSSTALTGTITGFTSNDTIDLLGFTATSASYAAGALTLTNASSAHVTLHFSGGPFNTGIASLTTVAGGTDIVLGSAPPSYSWIGGSTSWATAADWSGGVVPGTGASATISNAGSNAVTIVSGESVGLVGITLSNGNTLDVAGTLVPTGVVSVSSAALSVTGTGTVTGNTAGVGIGLYAAGASVVNQGTISGFKPIYGKTAPGTVINSGRIIGNATTVTGSGISFAAGGLVSNQSAGAISAATAVYIKGAVGTVVNYGGINGGTSAADYGVLLAKGGTVTNASGGTIGGYQGIKAFGGTVTLNNAGLVTSDSAHGKGIYLAAGGVVTNQAGATIAGSYGVFASTLPVTVSNAGSIHAMRLSDGGTVTNLSGGAIIGSSNGIYEKGTALSLVNAGSIAATTAFGTGANLVAGGQVTNQSGGVITGNYAIRDSAVATITNAGSIGGNTTIGAGVYFAAGGTLSNQSGGTITGDRGVLAVTIASTVINAGSIIANATAVSARGVSFAAGGLVSNQSSGTITGLQGVYVGGAAGTVVNTGSIGGNSATGIGVYLHNGGTITNRSGGTLSGGADAVKFAASQTNQLVIDPGATFTGTVDGGNTIGATSISTLELASGASAGTLSGLGSKYTRFAQATVDSQSNWILGGTNTWASGATLTNSGNLTLAASATLTNAGLITSSNAPDLVLASGAQLTNQSGGTIAVTAANVITAAAAATIVNAGVINGGTGLTKGIFLRQGGVVTNQSGGVITAGYGIGAVSAAATIVNAGTISGPNNSGFGINLAAGGQITNQAGGKISSTYVAVQALGTNALTLVNAGSISASRVGVVARANAVGNTLTNQSGGVIIGNTGIQAAYPSLYIVNAGQITGVSGYGVILQQGGTIIDSGTITGSTDAVGFTGGTGLLVLEQGYSLHGVQANTAVSATVELLGTSSGNAVAATYNSLGLVNVGTIGFAPTASDYATWTITSNSTLPGTITNFIGAHETIDLTALNDSGNNASVNFNSITNQLTVTAGGTSVSLQLGSGSYAGVSWVATNDGSNGTQVTLAPPAPPSISGAAANQAVANVGTITPFTAVSIADPTGNGTITATVTLSAAANGTLSNLGGGSFNGGTGVYSFTGSAAAATTAIDALVFTPASAASGVYVTTTDFTIGATGTGGSNSDSTTTVTAVQQVLGLAVVAPSNIVFSVSPDGSSFATATGGKTNEAVVTTPTASGSYALPAGYQAEFLGGSAAATLVDNGVGNAVLVGNSGADTIGAGSAANDSLVGGNGNNMLFPGVGTIAVVAGSGANVVAVPTGATGTVTLGSGNDTVYVSGTATINGGTGKNVFSLESVSGASVVNSQGADSIYAAGGLATVSISGTGALLQGGAAGTVTASVAGKGDTVVDNGGSIAVTASGSGGLFYGNAGSLMLTEQGTVDTIVAAGGAVTVNASTSPLIFGGGATLLVQGGAGTPTVIGGSAGASVVAGSGGVVAAAGGGTATVSGAATLFGAAGDQIDYVGSVGGAFVVGETGSETIDASGASASTLFYGNANASSTLVAAGGTGSNNVAVGGGGLLNFIGGAGAATVFGGSGTASVSAGSGGAEFVGSSGAATLSGAMTAFGASGGAINYVGSVGGATYYASSGAETIDASGSSAGNLMWAGASSVSSDLMVGGSGNDSLLAGGGADTMTGGSGNNLFVFLDGHSGGTATITDFTTQDLVSFVGYGSSAASAALAGAVSSGGNTTLTLSDSTQITFLGVSSASVLQGHVFSS